MALFEKLYSKKSAASRDASKIYRALMQASRDPEFFGNERVSDTYEGRLDILALHLSGLLSALRQHGNEGKRLSQAIYDIMVDDFDSALREEGLTDSGVKRRIKPMVSYVFTRIKQFDDYKPSDSNPRSDAKSASFPIKVIQTKPYIKYLQDYNAALISRSFSQLASGQIIFPKFKFECG